MGKYTEVPLHFKKERRGGGPQNIGDYTIVTVVICNLCMLLNFRQQRAVTVQQCTGSVSVIHNVTQIVALRHMLGQHSETVFTKNEINYEGKMRLIFLRKFIN